MADKKKILLLNPPGKKLYIRDYYCSKVSQADYVYHPIDLLIQSGIVAQEFEPVLIDAIIEKLSPAGALQKISQARVSAVISLAGSVSWPEDIAFLKELKKRENVPIIVSGDIFREEGEKILRENPFIDAIMLDFTNNDAVNFIKGEFGKLENMIYMENGGPRRVQKKSDSKEFSIPIPRHDLFFGRDYRYPFVRKRRFSTVLADFGCPFNCSFCIMAKLPYKWRPGEEIINEIKYLAGLGVNEFFLATQTFGASRKQAVSICEGIIREKINCGWTCFSRVDMVNEPLLLLMRQAGCHTIIFGVESGDEGILRKYRKDYTIEQIRNTIGACSRIGIETVATFILGLPEETEDSLRKTMALAAELPLDYASFNVAVPRMGTDLRGEALQLELVDERFMVMDQSGSEVAMPTRQLSRETVSRYRRRAVMNFYFRPSYLLRRIMKVRNLGSLARQLRQALALVRQTWLKG
jgi:radical SAM superfamily enzyme YgiQ (UPF0313 family)